MVQAPPCMSAVPSVKFPGPGLCRTTAFPPGRPASEPRPRPSRLPNGLAPRVARDTRDGAYEARGGRVPLPPGARPLRLPPETAAQALPTASAAPRRAPPGSPPGGLRGPRRPQPRRALRRGGPAPRRRRAGPGRGAPRGGRGRRRPGSHCFTLSPRASLRFFLAASSSLTKVAIAPRPRPDRTPPRRGDRQPKSQRVRGLAPPTQPAPDARRRRFACRPRPPPRR